MTARDDAWHHALGILVLQRREEAQRACADTVYIGDLDDPMYRWFFEQGIEHAELVKMQERHDAADSERPAGSD